MKRTLIFPGLLFVLLPLSLLAQSNPRVFQGKVVSVADGDTFTVLWNQNQIRVRLEGIDCPEKGQPFGNNAKQAVSNMVFGKVVRVEEQSKDRYKRSIAKVYLPDGRSVNEEMLRMGMAWHFKKYSSDVLYARLEQQARNAQRGLWSGANPIAPWEWRSNR
jgi:micrococcal nuclease